MWRTEKLQEKRTRSFNVKWYLNITREEFKELYPTGDISLFEREPESDEDFIANFLPNKLWRLNNIYTIIDKDGNKLRFNMNHAQHRAYSSMLRHPRVIILKSRQQGISTFMLINYFDDGIFIEDLNIGMLAQGLEEASTLLERVKTAWENFPPAIKDFLGVVVVKDNSKEYSFSNGSKIFIRTSFRSATLQRLHVSEMGKIANKDPQKAKELISGTMQAIKAGNPVVVESTAEGRKNQFYKMWYRAADFVGERGLKDFKPLFLSWVYDPDCVADIPQRATTEDQAYIDKVERDLDVKLTDRQKWWVVVQRRESGEDFDQEYPYDPESAFEAVRDGAYYARLWKPLRTKHIIDGLYDAALPVRVAIDLGMNDTMVLVYYQVHINLNGEKELRVIDVYYNSGEGLKHYVEQMRSTNYAIEKVILPHDVKVKELGTSKSRLAILRELGVRKTLVIPRTSSVSNDIELVRRAIPSLYIDADCSYIDDMLHNYSKQWDDKMGVWKDKPLHDEWSNPADAVRYMVIAEHSSGKSAKPAKMRKPRGIAL